MNTNDNNDIAAVEHALAVFSSSAASASEFRASAQAARAAVRAFDAKNESAPNRRAGVLADLKPRLAEMVALLEAIDDEDRTRALQREVAVALAAQLDARARAAEKVEAARDEARKPFLDQTRRAHELAEKVTSVFPSLAARIIHLFRDDMLISKLGAGAYSRLPRPQGTHIAYERTYRVPLVLATDEILAATKLPGHWPLRGGDYSLLDQPHFEDEDDEIVGPLRAQLQKSAASEGDVDRSIARAQAHLLAEYRKAVDAIEDLLRFDATITAADRALKYPDGAPIFDETKLPADWSLARMKQRIQLPTIGSPAMAAE